MVLAPFLPHVVWNPLALHAAATVAYSQSLKHTNLFLESASAHDVAFTWSSCLSMACWLLVTVSASSRSLCQPSRAGWRLPCPRTCASALFFQSTSPFMLTCPLSPHLIVNSWGLRPCSFYSLINDQCIRKYPIKCFC